MAQKRSSPTLKGSLTVRQRDLARESVVKDSFTTAVSWQARGSLPSPVGRRAGDEGAQHEQTIAGNVAEIMEA